MILGNISNYNNYLFNEKFKKAFDFLEEFGKNPLPVGKYEIDGENVYALVQEYEPGVGKRYESHLKYIDIQYIVNGNEKIGYTDIKNAAVEEDKTPANDAIFYTDIKNSTMLNLAEGDFAVFFPEDLHLPCVKNTADKVTKVVIKISV